MSEPQEVLPSEEESDETLVARIDALADFLLRFAQREDATGTLKVKIFGEAVAWAKVKAVIDSKGAAGARLKELGNELEAGKRSGTTRRITGAAARSRELREASGAEIRRLIRALPAKPRPDEPGRDTEDPQREGERDRSAIGGGVVDVPGDGQGDGDGTGNRGEL